MAHGNILVSRMSVSPLVVQGLTSDTRKGVTMHCDLGVDALGSPLSQRLS